ncbi:MAG: hypothetical protein H6714_09850 [Myxococcales bacterium]|nr:hypothetical protein [Myxococcales bacterium]
MPATDVERLKFALTQAGVEVYRAFPEEIYIAERVRVHLMDSSIRVGLGTKLSVSFTARCQRSDFPNSPPEELFAKVRNRVGPFAGARGYAEASHRVTEIKNPTSPSQVLDTWHEVTYTKNSEDVGNVVDEVRWALEIEKYIAT